jgi:hypothetical protein
VAGFFIMYDVRINGQLIGPLTAAAVKQRSQNWRAQGLRVEVAATGSGAFLPLDQFLAQLSSASPPAPNVPAPSAATPAKSGTYDVRVNNQIIAALERSEIEKRAANWLKLNNTAVAVAAAGTKTFVPLKQFLAQHPITSPAAPVNPAPAPAAAAAAGAASASGKYDVRINNQIIAALDRTDVEKRAANWLTLKAAVEVAATGTKAFIPLKQFLAQRPATSPVGPAAAAAIVSVSGKYDVRVNNQIIAALDRAEIVKRAASWLKLKTAVEVAAAGTKVFIPLGQFLAQPQPKPSVFAALWAQLKALWAKLTSALGIPGTPIPAEAVLVSLVVLLAIGGFYGWRNWGQEKETETQTTAEAGTGDALSDSVVACYEIIRFTIVDAAGKDGDDLKSLAPRFGKLAAAYKSDRARMSDADLPGIPNSGRTLAKQFQSLDTVFESLNSAVGAGSRDHLLEALVTARYQIQDIQATLAALADNAALARSGPTPPQPQPQPEPEVSAHINTLTHIVVDSATGRVSFHGTDDLDGPRHDIPYAQFFAAALLLPEELGSHGVVGSVPGFSLEPIQDIGAVYANLMNTVKTPDGQAAVLRKFQAALQDPDTAKYLVNQCLDDIRAWLENYISQKTSSRDWVAALDQATNLDELAAAAKDLANQGVLDKQDLQALAQEFGTAVQARLQSRGGLLFLPERLLKATFDLSSFSRPTYFGIEDDTQFARTVFESDFALKTLAGPRGHELARKLNYHQTLIEWMVNHTSPDMLQHQDAPPLGIIQVAPESIGLAASADKTVVSFEKPAMRIITAARSPGQQLAPLQLSYADFLTQHYDDYARAIPPLWEIREAVKVVAAVRLLRKAGRAVSPDDLDTSWSAPSSVETEWDFVLIGLGPSQNPTDGAGYTGGVDLQVQSHMQVKDLSAAQARDLAAPAHPAVTMPATVSGHAAGYPIATEPEKLENLDPSDAKANLANMTRQDLQDLRNKTTERSSLMERQIEVLHKQAFGLDLKATSPPNFIGWSDVVAKKIDDLPGVHAMEELSKWVAGRDKPVPPDLNAKIDELKKNYESVKGVKELTVAGMEALDGSTREKLNKLLDLPADAKLSGTDYYKRFLALSSSTDDMSRTLLKAVAEDAPTSTTKMLLTTGSIALESGQAYYAVANSHDRMEGFEKSAPHIATVMKELLPKSGQLAGIARAAGEDSVELTRFGLRSTVALKVGEASLGLAYEAANIGIVNEGLRQDKDINRVLYSELSGNRASLTHRVEENKRLVGLIDQQLSGK